MSSKTTTKRKNTFLDFFKFSAVGAAGSILGIVPQLLIGTIILVFGIYLVSKEKKPNTDKKEYNHDFEFYLGIGFIIIGSVLSLNLFFGLEFITGLFDN